MTPLPLMQNCRTRQVAASFKAVERRQIGTIVILHARVRERGLGICPMSGAASGRLVNGTTGDKLRPAFT